MTVLYKKPYRFCEVTAGKYRHTDSTYGSHYNFLALMLEGTSRITDGKREIVMTAGDAFFIPLGCRYHSYWYGDDAVSWTSLAFSEFPGDDDGRYVLQKLRADESQKRRITELGRYSRVDCASVGKLYTLLHELVPIMERESISQKQALINTAARYMAEAPHAPICEVAKRCNVSESGLYAAFRECGTTPSLKKQQLQIEHALTLITTTELTADEIAERVGFNSTAYFLRVLKKLTGKTTRELRRSEM